ncbi:MAG: glycosyltransferase family 1 protein [Patescibacteria group bacterium]
MKKNPLILGIDASRSLRKNATGVERYSTEIIRHLIKENVDFELRLYTPRLNLEFPEEMQWVIPFPRLWTLIRLSFEMLIRKPDLLFIPSHVLPFFAPKKSFVMIHDIVYEKYPQAYSLFQRLYLKWSTHRAVKKAVMVFTPTEAVRQDLIKRYGANPKKVKAIHHGPIFLPTLSKKDKTEILSHFSLTEDEPLFFFIGRLETKKNLLTLLDAWKIVQKKCSQGRLFLGGMQGHGWNELYARLEEEDLAGTVLVPGYISDLEAAALFESSSALMLPSFDEGFGMPILQAFESQCPVICSDIAALREVAADAALYSPTLSAEGFAHHIIKLIEKPELQKKLAENGQNRLKAFSWKKSAAQHLSFFRENS